MKRILIAEDEKDIRTACRRILERAGYAVLEAGNGEEALQFLKNQPVDILITDIVMPEKDGIELIQEISDDYPHVRVIAVSGGGAHPAFADNYLKTTKALGAEITLKKPFTPEDLLTAVKSILKDTK